MWDSVALRAEEASSTSCPGVFLSELLPQTEHVVRVLCFPSHCAVSVILSQVSHLTNNHEVKPFKRFNPITCETLFKHQMALMSFTPRGLHDNAAQRGESLC